MSLAAGLLNQARMLATIDARRPKQVNLRRAVSAAYYGLFHLLTGEAAGLYATDFSLAARITRTFNHSDLRKVSAAVSGRRRPKQLQPGEAYEAPADLKLVANAVVQLQNERHDADYDTARDFERKEALQLIERVAEAFAAWERVKKSHPDDARLYLACFLLWDRWDKEPR